jgi:hypothetical protein
MGDRRKQGAEEGGAVEIYVPFDPKPVNYVFKAEKLCLLKYHGLRFPTFPTHWFCTGMYTVIYTGTSFLRALVSGSQLRVRPVLSCWDPDIHYFRFLAGNTG